MLIIVIANPIQFTIVSAVPLIFGAALLATKVENKGESAITTIPQKSRNPTNMLKYGVVNTHGDTRQHKQERSNAIDAVVLTPDLWEMFPARTQASPPTAIILNDSNGTLISWLGFILP